MDSLRDDERIIMVMAEPGNGDDQRALEQLEEWSAKFGAERVKGNEGLEALPRPLMNAPSDTGLARGVRPGRSVA